MALIGGYFTMKKKPLLTEAQMQQLIKEAGWHNLTKEELTEEVNRQLEIMVKAGEVEQLIGEDGEFYYRAAKRGS
jgi:hypothetical protein